MSTAIRASPPDRCPVGSEPQPSDDTVSTGGSLEPLAPVTDAVNTAGDSLGL